MSLDESACRVEKLSVQMTIVLLRLCCSVVVTSFMAVTSAVISHFAQIASTVFKATFCIGTFLRPRGVNFLGGYKESAIGGSISRGFKGLPPPPPPPPPPFITSFWSHLDYQILTIFSFSLGDLKPSVKKFKKRVSQRRVVQ